MRTNKERARLICRRAAALRRKRLRLAAAAGTAVCLLVIAAAAMLMPGQTAGLDAAGIRHASGTASLIGSHAALGYILMGLLSFLLGVCITVLLFRLRRRSEHRRQEERDDEL